ncbi:hypothetical protein [Streptomyces sp. NPDC127033]|uniref:hypothetical protein n=1 Tax=Streptomyces sp. NPDC127033 TaxID=3347110 RepID=UPI003662719C
MYAIFVRFGRAAETAQGFKSDEMVHQLIYSAQPTIEHAYIHCVNGKAEGVVFVKAGSLDEARLTVRTACESLIAQGQSSWRLETCDADLLNVSSVWLPVPPAEGIVT